MTHRGFPPLARLSWMGARLAKRSPPHAHSRSRFSLRHEVFTPELLPPSQVPPPSRLKLPRHLYLQRPLSPSLSAHASEFAAWSCLGQLVSDRAAHLRPPPLHWESTCSSGQPDTESRNGASLSQKSPISIAIKVPTFEHSVAQFWTRATLSR
jgi:hypothetical protein